MNTLKFIKFNFEISYKFTPKVTNRFKKECEVFKNNSTSKNDSDYVFKAYKK